MKKMPKHLLVIRLSAMGDVAMVALVLRALVSQHPQLKITVLSKPFLAPLFDSNPAISFVGAETNSHHKGLLGLYRLYKELKSRDIDGIADLHNVLRSRLLCLFFAGTKSIRLDKGRDEKKALIRRQNKVFRPLKTTHERYADVFREFGFDTDLSKTPFPTAKPLPTPLKNKTAWQKTQKHIGIAPFAQHPSKNYPLDLMEVVIQKLSARSNVQLLLFGGGNEEIRTLSALEKKYPNTLCIAGKIHLNEELLLISHLNCMLSMDSGNGHFAALCGIPTLTLWGGTHPHAGFAPFRQPAENSLIPDLKKYPLIPYSVYGNKTLPGYENAMRTIAPEAVVKQVLHCLEAKTP